jgi:DNA-directed RNA polymerase specialized sigma24 family protein
METKALHNYRGESSLKTYLREVAYNYFKRLADKDQHRKIAEAKFFSQEQLEVMLATERESLKSNVRKGIAKMKDERNAFIIQKMFVDDFTKGEIMFELDVEKGSHFDVLKNRAKKEFARCYLELKNE